MICVVGRLEAGGASAGDKKLDHALFQAEVRT